MSITINGTTGIAGVDGTASAPSVQGADSNTGVFFPATDTVAVTTGGTERMRVDSSGQVIVGTGTASKALTVIVNGTGTPISGGAVGISLSNTDTTTSSLSAFTAHLYDPGGNQRHAATIAFGKDGTWVTGSSFPAYMSFWTRASSGDQAERMRIDSNGNVGIGTNSPTSPLTLYRNSATSVAVNTGNSINSWLSGVDSSGNFSFYTNGAYSTYFSTSGTERMRIDASGRVTTPYQPAFIAAGLAAQTTYTAGQVIVFNTAPLNIGSGYSTSTGRFTAPVAGTYAFTFQVYLNPGNGNAPIAFYKNGTMEIFSLQGVALSGIGLSTIISLAASDYVEVRVRGVAGATATVFNGADHTQFTGYLIG